MAVNYTIGIFNVNSLHILHRSWLIGVVVHRYNNLDPAIMAKSEEGLSKLLSYLREVAEHERLAGIEALKPVGTQAWALHLAVCKQATDVPSFHQPCITSTCLGSSASMPQPRIGLQPPGSLPQAGSFTEYRIKANAAQRLAGGQEPLDNRCWARSSASLLRLGPRLVVLGGSLLGSGQGSMDAFWATDDRMEWHRQVFADGDCPPARDGHACIVNDTRYGCAACMQIVLCRGGAMISPATPKVPVAALGPQAAGAHLPCRLVLFGGRNQEGRRLNDVWSLDTAAWAWERVPTIGAVPPQRSGAAAACHHGRLVIVGGRGNESALYDTWVLDLLSAQPAWKQVTTTGSRVSLRHFAAHCLHGECRS